AAGWLSGFQAGLTAAVFCAVTAFAEPRGWLADPRGLQAYGVALGLLCLGWVAGRRLAPGPLWEAFTPGIDRLTLALLVVGELLLALVAAWPAVLAEWGLVGSAKVPAAGAHVWGPGGWLLLGVLAAAVVALLEGPGREGEETEREAAVVGLVLLGASAPLLFSALHAADLAAASAARWGLAAYFLAGSALLWGRGSLARLARAAGLAMAPASAICHGLFAGVAGAVVLLTAVLAGLGFA